MPTSHSSAAMREGVREVLCAKDSVELFGPNEKRAKIRYRRLVREVHPDVNGNSPESQGAMKKLNKLWDEYGSRTGIKQPMEAGKRRPTEITRNGTFAVLCEGVKWVAVERVAIDGLAGRNGPDCTELEEILDGSPVCLARHDKVKIISQNAGSHVAYELRPARTIAYGRRMLFLSSLRAMLPDGKLHPADFAWISKRVLFLTGAMTKSGTMFGPGPKDVDGNVNPIDCLAIAPDTHMLVVVTSRFLIDGDDGLSNRDGVIRAYLRCVNPMLRDDHATQRMVRFLQGVIGDRAVGSKELMCEFDDLLAKLFGGLHFHEMETL